MFKILHEKCTNLRILGVEVYNIIIGVVYAVYSTVAFIIFNKVNSLSSLNVDEVYHIPQGILYCQWQFDEYDPKISTPPGLYTLTALLLGIFDSKVVCTAYWLRFINLIAGLINLEILRQLCNLKTTLERDRPTDTLEVKLQAFFNAINIALLPPLYFFNNLYYTDTLSVTVVLVCMWCARFGHHGYVCILGFISCLFRQTNILWVCLIFGEFILIIFMQCTLSGPNGRNSRVMFKIHDLYRALRRIIREARIYTEHITGHEKKQMLYYGVTFIIYGNCIIMNGGIAVGDKDAHPATLHLTQLLYFALFTLIFNFPTLILELSCFLTHANRNLKKYSIISVILLCIIFVNTQVHPYLLADNRHYTFYIWNRFYGKYTLFRYIMIPVYIFAYFAILKRLMKYSPVTFYIPYCIALFLGVAVHRMIEIRYFLIPYVIYRARTTVFNWRLLISEFIFIVCFNYVTLNIYFTKTFYWQDFFSPQRIIW